MPTLSTMKLQTLIFVIYCSTFGATQQLCNFSPSDSGSEISEQCLDQLKVICNNPSILWQMYDASSKYPFPGMSYSNNRDYGNFDECIAIDREYVVGKYCGLSAAVINVFLKPIPNPQKLSITNNVSSRALTDEVSLSLLSLCVPDQCTPKEVGEFFLFGNIGIENLSLVNFIETMPCITKYSFRAMNAGDTAVTVFLASILLIITLSTCYDLVIQKLERQPHHPILLSFSIMTNGKKLFNISLKKNPDQIQCFNGVRFISMMWVIAGHGMGVFANIPLLNYAEVHKYLDSMGIMYIASAPMAVDTFFFMSGFLFAYSFLKASSKITVRNQIYGIPMMIVHRYLRLTPALAVLYLIFITIFKHLGSGPAWGAYDSMMIERCRTYWWSFFLYIQNYVNYNEVCLEHTWYLSADMQLFILAPLVLIPIAYLINNGKNNTAIYTLLGLIAFCVIFPMIISFADTTIDNTYDTHSRFTDYLIGVLMGVIMRDPRFQRFHFSRLVNVIIWIIVLAADVGFNLYYHDVFRNPEHTKSTLYRAFYRPIWCFSLAWMVYSCHHGYGGPINWFLSHPIFQIGARLSYCMYLIHLVVLMYWAGTLKTTNVWSDYYIFYVWCGHFIVTLVLSVIWTLAFESPMIIIEKCIFGTGGKKSEETKKSDDRVP